MGPPRIPSQPSPASQQKRCQPFGPTHFDWGIFLAASYKPALGINPCRQQRTAENVEPYRQAKSFISNAYKKLGWVIRRSIPNNFTCQRPVRAPSNTSPQIRPAKPRSRAKPKSGAIG